MKIISIDKLKSKRSTGVPVLRISKNKVSFGTALATMFKTDDEEKVFLQFAMNENTLHVKVVTPETEDKGEFVRRSNKQWELYHSGMAQYLRELSGSEEDSIPCRVTSPDADGWHPVITSYWKTICNQ